MDRLLQTTALLAALVGLPASAAGSDRVVVATSDPELTQALGSALLPSGMVVVVVGDRPELASYDALSAAREVTAAEQGFAAVWVVRGQDASSSLAVFDGRLDRVVTREVPYSLPYSPSQAASAALMVRTMLRAHQGDAREAHQSIEATAPPASPSAPSPWGLGLEAGIGGKAGGWTTTGVPVVAGAIVGYRSRVGVALAVGWSSPESREEATFAGQLEDQWAALVLRFPFRGARWSLEPGAGVAFHWIRAVGTLPNEATREVSLDRVDPAARVSAAVAFSATRRFEPAIHCDADLLLRRQRLFFADELIASFSPVQATCLLAVRIRAR